MKIGCMLWRIGERLNFFSQLDWVRDNRFDEVSFWSFPGDSERWRGFDLVASAQSDLHRLKDALSGIAEVDIHAPSAPWSDLDTGLTSPDPAARQQALDQLQRLLERCAHIGAKVLTLHPGRHPDLGTAAWRQRTADSLLQAECLAREFGVRIGLELTSDYDLAMMPSCPNIGLTVDTGHMQFKDGAGYRAFGSLGALIERLGPRVFHMHLHDYDGKLDHLAIGDGKIDFHQILQALIQIHYNGSLCLELNPDVVSPEGILHSRTALKKMLDDLSPNTGHGGRHGS